ncbi:MAG: hypothetical protein ACI865_001782 [Flavobacteriaceae bacterium]
MLHSCLRANSGSEKEPDPLSEKVKEQRLKEIYNYSEQKDSLPNSYFTYFGFRDSYRWPLVYPYSINSADSRDDGYIADERDAKDIRYSSDGIEQLCLWNINRFTFNGEVLVLIHDEGNNPTFNLLIFDTQEIIEFKSYDELMLKASEFGILSTNSLISLEQYSLYFNA